MCSACLTFVDYQSIDFEPAGFAPFLSAAVPQLIQIMAEADTLESKRKVDESLNTLIEQSGTLVSSLFTAV